MVIPLALPGLLRSLWWSPALTAFSTSPWPLWELAALPVDVKVNQSRSQRGEGLPPRGWRFFPMFLTKATEETLKFLNLPTSLIAGSAMHVHTGTDDAQTGSRLTQTDSVSGDTERSIWAIFFSSSSIQSNCYTIYSTTLLQYLFHCNSSHLL